RRWLFLTGDEAEIHELLQSFHLRAAGSKPDDYREGDKAPMHTQKLILVDHTGRVAEGRAYFDGLDVERQGEGEGSGEVERNYAALKKRAHRLAAEVRPGWMPLPFPAFNAMLNGVAAALICAGWASIKAGLRRLHVVCMLAALAVSALFLASYLYYHLIVK